MDWKEITEEEVTVSIKSTTNWKALGVDGITNFSLKRLHVIHKIQSIAYNNTISNKHVTPRWLTKGKTHLIPKNENTKKAENYRPITCLNNTYKILTKIISERLHGYLKRNNLFPAEQRGCVNNTYGCKDHLLTSKTIHRDCKEGRKNLTMLG